VSVIPPPDAVQALFTRQGDYAFARWGRPIVPVAFGIEDETLRVLKGAIEAVVAVAGHATDEQDTELGANLMFFFCREWDDLLGVPNLDRMIEGLDGIVARLKAGDANQYRTFRFDEQGAIRAAFVLLRVDDVLARMPADVLALEQAARVMLLWGEGASEQGLLARSAEGHVVLRAEIAGILRAAYDPVMPHAARDASHGLRLWARLQANA